MLLKIMRLANISDLETVYKEFQNENSINYTQSHIDGEFYVLFIYYMKKNKPMDVRA